MRVLISMLGACATAPAGGPVLGADSAPVDVAPCATGCSGPSAADVPLGSAEIERLLGDMERHPVGAADLAVETLLFHGVEVLDHLDRETVALTQHVAWLRRELSRDRVEVGFRLVADDGTVLGWRDDEVDLATKHHLVLRDTGALGRADVNGKVKRVGVKHLWARF